MMDTLRTFGSPSRYIQGQDASNALPEIAAEFGTRSFVLMDDIVSSAFGPAIRKAYDAHQSAAIFSRFSGECTLQEIGKQAKAAEREKIDVVVGVGGGKTIDTAKGVSLELDVPIVVVPSIASNDAPTSRLIVIYDEDHRISEVRKLPQNPDVVLVDTRVIAKAPARFLLAGIGDAIAKKFEAEQCEKTNALNFFGGRQTATALALCNSCYEIIRKHSAAALAAVEENQVNDHVEYIVEANVLLSGLGFESGGLALAHGLTRGLTAQKETRNALHGELVAWGLLVQLIAEERPAEFVSELVTFYEDIGLPTRLSKLGFNNLIDSQIQEIATVTHREAPYIKNLAIPLSVDRLIECIKEVERQ